MSHHPSDLENTRQDWHHDKYVSVHTERDRYFVLSVVLVIALAINGIAWLCVIPLKETVLTPYVMMVDNVTGITATLTSSKTAQLDENISVIRYFLGKYVQSYQSFSPATTKQQQDYVRGISDPQVYGAYENYWESPELIKLKESLGSQGEIEIQVVSVTFPYDEIAHVRYVETIKRANVPLQKTTWLATLKFDQLDEVDESIAATNPLGLVVINFETIKESNDA